MRSESRTDETSGLVTTTAMSAWRIASVAPRSMPAGLSQTIQSNFSRSSPSTRSTPASVSASLSRVCEAGRSERLSRRLSRISACASFASPCTTLMKSNTTRRSAPMTRSRLRRPTSKSTTHHLVAGLREGRAEGGRGRRLADAALARCHDQDLGHTVLSFCWISPGVSREGCRRSSQTCTAWPRWSGPRSSAVL